MSLVPQTWEEVIADWFRGTVPPCDSGEVMSALRTVERLYPELIGEALTAPAYSRMSFLRVIWAGRILRACEHLGGFQDVLRRVRNGNQSALSELEFAMLLQHQGLSPQLEPGAAGKELDVSVEVGPAVIWVEVIRPDMAKVTEKLQERMGRLVNEAMAILPGRDTRVELLGDWADKSDDYFLDILRSVGDAPAAGLSGPCYEIRVRALDPNGSQPPIVPDPPPMFVTPTALPPTTTVHVCASQVDFRAYQFISQEMHHFESGKVNLLAIDLSRIGRLEDWPEMATNAFTPDMHTSLSGILLYRSIAWANDFDKKRGGILILNPHALAPIPAEAVAVLRAVFPDPFI